MLTFDYDEEDCVEGGELALVEANPVPVTYNPTPEVSLSLVWELRV